MNTWQAAATLIGRILLAAIFVISGFGKLMAAEATQKHMADAGLPLVPVLYILTVLIELGGGLLIILGWQGRIAAAVIFLFLIPVTLTFHWEWGNRMQETAFYKNMAIMGGLLMVTVFGPGPWSLDARRRSAARSGSAASSPRRRDR